MTDEGSCSGTGIVESHSEIDMIAHCLHHCRRLHQSLLRWSPAAYEVQKAIVLLGGVAQVHPAGSGVPSVHTLTARRHSEVGEDTSSRYLASAGLPVTIISQYNATTNYNVNMNII